jgi:soluble lytic murein transglycosylase-like protein
VKHLILIALMAGIGWSQTTSASEKPAPASAKGATAKPDSEPAKPDLKPDLKRDTASPASTPNAQAAMAANQASMNASVAKQRASVMQQVNAITGKAAPAANSFFTVPWIDNISALAAPLCDPMPAEQLDKLIERSSSQQGVKSDLVRAVISEESAGRPCAVSPKGAQGLMQLMPETAQLFGVKDAFDPEENVDAGTRLLKQLLTKYGGDVSRTLSAYNAGEARVDQQGGADGVPPIAETVNYVKDILAKLAGQ